MAKKREHSAFIKGKSVTDILNTPIDVFNSLQIFDLRETVGRLVSAANKRLRTFERKGLSSPAVERVKDSGGKFSTRGKNLNQLRAEFARLRGFFQSPTSTIKGVKKLENKVVNALKKQGVDISHVNYEKFWRAYERLKKIDPSIENTQLRYSYMREIASVMEDTPDIDAIIEKMSERISLIYEEQRAVEDEFFNDTGFFEI